MSSTVGRWASPTAIPLTVPSGLPSVVPGEAERSQTAPTGLEHAGRLVPSTLRSVSFAVARSATEDLSFIGSLFNLLCTVATLDSSLMRRFMVQLVE